MIALLAVGLFSCKDWMNAEPEGSTKTESQIQEASTANPNAAKGSVAAIYSQMIQCFAGLGDLGYDQHNDFGYSSVCLTLETYGQDFIGDDIGYNWFSDSDYAMNRDNTLSSNPGLIAHMIWNNYYKIIYACNNVIGAADRENPGAMQTGLGQALAVRAFCYMQLMQLYAPAYDAATAATTLCVPIVVDHMPAERLLNNPRASLASLDSLVTNDLNEAIRLLEGFVPENTGYVSEAVAYGLRARYSLLKHDGAQAVSDARKALVISGATPLTIEEAGVPGFCNAGEHNVLWANILTENNDVVQTAIINWESHLGSFYTDGYTAVGAYRMISSALYNQVGKTDVRRGWWLDGNGKSPLVAGNYSKWLNYVVNTPGQYVNVKFGTKDNSVTGMAGAASDWILMRAEEMYLIIAEGLAMDGGDAQGELENFVRSYRDPGYKVTTSIEDAIWIQRRIELWGEGYSFFDILRLHKPIIRTNSSNWSAKWGAQDIPADHGCLLLRIPENEIEANQGLTAADAPYVAAPI